MEESLARVSLERNLPRCRTSGTSPQYVAFLRPSVLDAFATTLSRTRTSTTRPLTGWLRSKVTSAIAQPRRRRCSSSCRMPETIQSFKKERPQLRNAKELTEHTPDAQRIAAIVSATQPGSVTFVSSRCTTLAPFICMDKSGTVTVLQTFCSSSAREQLELMERTACCGCQGNYLMHVCTQHLEATLWARDTGAGVVAATAEDVKKEVEAEAAAGRLAALIEEKREAAAARREQAHGLRSGTARQLGVPASEWLGRLMQNCGCSANTSQVSLVVGACRAVMEKRDELVVALVECSSVTASNQVWPIMCQAVNKLAAEIPKCREAPSTLSLITFGDTAKELSRTSRLGRIAST